MTKTTKELNDYEVTSDSEYDLESIWYSEEEYLEIVNKRKQIISKVLEILDKNRELTISFEDYEEIIKQIEELKGK